jgi:hypothetical protein
MDLSWRSRRMKGTRHRSRDRHGRRRSVRQHNGCAERREEQRHDQRREFDARCVAHGEMVDGPSKRSVRGRLMTPYLPELARLCG